MIRALQIAGLALLIACTGVVLWLGAAAHRVLVHLDGATVRLEGVESKANATLINLDKGSAIWASSAQSEAKDVSDTMLQVRGTLSGAQDAFESIPPAVGAIKGTADAGTSLLASAQKTTDVLPTAIQHIRADFDATQEPVSEIGQDAADFDALLKQKSLSDTLDSIAQTSHHAAQISGDFDTRFHALLFPPPCRTFGCRMSKYVWPAIKDAGALGEDSYWIWALTNKVKP